jgi:hypothetical protein
MRFAQQTPPQRVVFASGEALVAVTGEVERLEAR